MKASMLGVLVLAVDLSAHGGLYSFTDQVSDGDILPNGGNTLVLSHNVGGADPAIQSVILTLDFSGTSQLTGNASGIQGRLYLGPSSSPAYVSFSPTGYTPTASGYECTLSFSTPLATLNPNTTWTLNLYDTSSAPFGNSLVRWGMEINSVNPVPEPLNLSLSVFGVLVVGVGGTRWYLQQRKSQQQA